MSDEVIKTLEPGGRIVHKFIDRTDWGTGEWDDEPDICIWRDVWTQYYCVAARNEHLGAWCGYVGIPSAHQLYGLDYNSEKFPDLDVYGGVTFASFKTRSGIAKTDEKLYWIGFDCMHLYDYPPRDITKLLPDRTKNLFEGAVYKNLIYVRTECEALARQLKEWE